MQYKKYNLIEIENPFDKLLIKMIGFTKKYQYNYQISIMQAGSINNVNWEQNIKQYGIFSKQSQQNKTMKRKIINYYTNLRAQINPLLKKTDLMEDLIIIDNQLRQIQNKKYKSSNGTFKDQNESFFLNHKERELTHSKNQKSDLIGLKIKQDFHNINQNMKNQKPTKDLGTKECIGLKFNKNKENKLTTVASDANFKGTKQISHKKESSIILSDSLKLTNKLYKNYKNIYGHDQIKMQLVDSLFSELKTMISN